MKIDFADMASRLSEVPVSAGNYCFAAGHGQAPLLAECSRRGRAERAICNASTSPTRARLPETVLADVKGYEISLDRKKMLVRKGEDFFILDSDAKAATVADPKALAKATINLSRWTILTNPARGVSRHLPRCVAPGARLLLRPQHAWRRLAEMRDRYLPLVDRVADREELNNVIAQMVGELSALHTFVLGGDARKPADEVDIATLGASSPPRRKSRRVRS